MNKILINQQNYKDFQMDNELIEFVKTDVMPNVPF